MLSLAQAQQLNRLFTQLAEHIANLAQQAVDPAVTTQSIKNFLISPEFMSDLAKPNENIPVIFPGFAQAINHALTTLIAYSHNEALQHELSSLDSLRTQLNHHIPNAFPRNTPEESVQAQTSINALFPTSIDSNAWQTIIVHQGEEIAAREAAQRELWATTHAAPQVVLTSSPAERSATHLPTAASTPTVAVARQPSAPAASDDSGFFSAQSLAPGSAFASASSSSASYDHQPSSSTSTPTPDGSQPLRFRPLGDAETQELRTLLDTHPLVVQEIRVREWIPLILANANDLLLLLLKTQKQRDAAFDVLSFLYAIATDFNVARCANSSRNPDTIIQSYLNTHPTISEYPYIKSAMTAILSYLVCEERQKRQQTPGYQTPASAQASSSAASSSSMFAAPQAAVIAAAPQPHAEDFIVEHMANRLHQELRRQPQYTDQALGDLTTPMGQAFSTKLPEIFMKNAVSRSVRRGGNTGLVGITPGNILYYWTIAQENYRQKLAGASQASTPHFQS